MNAPPRAPWPPRLRAKRLRLRAIRPADSPPRWLADAERALSAQGDCSLPDRLGAGDRGYWIVLPHAESDDVVGALAARLDHHDLIWTWLAVGALWRLRGIAAAAVPLVERAARRQDARRARVLVPGSNGVAFYFWLRLGYRPLPVAPWPREGSGAWMVRDLL